MTTDEKLMEILPDFVEIRDAVTTYKARSEKAEDEVNFLRQQNNKLIEMLKTSRE